MTRTLAARVGAMAVAIGLLAACSTPQEEEVSGAGRDDLDAGSWEPVYVDGVLQPLSDGFPSEPITILVADEAGSDDGLYARHVQAAATDKAPVRVEVLDRPDFGQGYGTWTALDYMSQQADGRDGHMLLVAPPVAPIPDLLATDVAAALGVGLEDLSWIATTEEQPWIIMSRTGAPWGDSFEGMIEHGRNNPGEITYISRGPGATPTVAMKQYLEELGVEVQEVIGGSIQEVNLSLGAGVGDIAINVVGSVVPFITDERVVMLACTGNSDDPCPTIGAASGAPRAGALAGLETDPWGSDLGLLVPSEVPGAHKAWLTELIRAVTDDDAFVGQRENIPGTTVKWLGPEETVERDRALYDSVETVLSELGLLDPSVEQK